jgi:hypothetical protein
MAETTPETVMCCCGRLRLQDGEGVVINGVMHEQVGKGRFCGSVRDHTIQDLLNAVADKDKRMAELKRHIIELMWKAGVRQKEKPFYTSSDYQI